MLMTNSKSATPLISFIRIFAMTSISFVQGEATSRSDVRSDLPG